MKKMRNNQVQSGVIIQQMKQQWSFYNQSPSGRLLGVELDYLLYSEVSLLWTLIRNAAATLPIKCTPPEGSKAGSNDYLEPPSWWGIGGSATEDKNRCKITL